MMTKKTPSFAFIRYCVVFCLLILCSSAYSARFFAPEEMSFATPKRIALLLPLSGNHAEAAKAIQDGYLASYYEQGGHKPAIRVYDTTQPGGIQQVYEKALREGADFVVGPLTKEDVHQLSLLPAHQLQTPVLALNHHPQVRQAPRHFVQFSLTPELEAIQLAEKAKRKGFQTASIIVPENEWGTRISSAFIHRWEKLGGEIIRAVSVNPAADQATSVRRLLGIPDTQPKRRDEDENEKEKPVRPQPVDVIVIAAPPEQARQLKPLMDFYYAHNIPTYATSSIYTGHPNPKRDMDMNGIIFCDMPWLIDPLRAKEMQQLLSRNPAKHSDQYKRLFAMGVDAYYLSTHMAALRAGEQYAGVTGELSLGQNNHIRRNLAWALMKRGTPVMLSS